MVRGKDLFILLSLAVFLAGCSRVTTPPISAPPASQQALATSARPIQFGKFTPGASINPIISPSQPPASNQPPVVPSPSLLPPLPSPLPQMCQATPPPDFPRDPTKICLPYQEITPQNNCVCGFGNWERVEYCNPNNWMYLIECQRRNLQCGYIRYCHAKPIVYLYPTVPTLVNVLLEIPGTIPVSEPHYPDGGWKGILARPNGQLLYKSLAYPYLYYESEVDKVNAPSTGIVLKTSDLQSSFTALLAGFGLNQKEIADFNAYWVPRLTSYNKPYVLFSLLDPIEKDRIDRVIITPKPDTEIMVNAYFRLLDHPVDVKPLALPQTSPKRQGFTMVEWGGVIEPEP